MDYADLLQKELRERQRERVVLFFFFFSQIRTTFWKTSYCFFTIFDRKQLSKYPVCLVGVKTMRMENREKKIGWIMAFSTIWFRKENKGERKWGKIFSPRTHIFFYPLNLGGRRGGKSAKWYTFPHFIHLTYPSLYSFYLMSVNLLPTFLLPNCLVKLLVQVLIYTSFSASWFAQLNY